MFAVHHEFAGNKIRRFRQEMFGFFAFALSRMMRSPSKSCSLIEQSVALKSTFQRKRASPMVLP